MLFNLLISNHTLNIEKSNIRPNTD